jgi:hypothetical protein
MSEVLLSIILVIITLLGTILTKVVIPYIQAKLNQATLKDLNFWIEMALYAAEQLYQDANSGVDKKEYVRRFVKNKIPDITDEQVDILIEGIGKSLGIFKEDNPDGVKTITSKQSQDFI